MRSLLLACIASTLLAGCVGSDPPAAVAPVAVEAGPAPPAPPEPVRIEERIDLRDGLEERLWTVRVEEGHEERSLVARLEGVNGTVLTFTDGYCFHLEVRPDDGEREQERGGACETYLSSHTVGTGATLLVRHGHQMMPGEHRFSFWSDPAVAVFTLEWVAA